MNSFEQSLGEKLGKNNLRKIQKVKIGIAGLGGLGSNCAVNLVRTGFIHFVLADFDKVDHSNLNRQFYFHDQIGMNKTRALTINLKRINSHMKIKKIITPINADTVIKTFKECDIVVEALDKAEYKKILIERLLPTKKFIVSASGLCGYGKSDDLRINVLKKNLVLIGDLKSDNANFAPLSPRVNIAAAKQADVVLEYVLKHR